MWGFFTFLQSLSCATAWNSACVYHSLLSFHMNVPCVTGFGISQSFCTTKSRKNLHFVPVLWMGQSHRQMHCTRSSAERTHGYQTLFLQHLTSVLCKDCCISGASSLYHHQQHKASPHRQDGECSDSCTSEKECHQEVAFLLSSVHAGTEHLMLCRVWLGWS